MNNSKIDSFLTCPQRYFLSYHDQSVKSKATIEMLRGKALHESIAHFVNLYNMVYQRFNSHPSESVLIPSEKHLAEYFPSKKRTEFKDDIDIKNEFHQKIISAVVEEMKKSVMDDRHQTDINKWASQLTDRAVKTFNRIMVGSAKAEGIYSPPDLLSEAKEIIEAFAQRELTQVLAPPSELFRNGKKSIQEFGMEGHRIPIHVEKQFILKKIGGREDIDMIVIFDRIDLEKEDSKDKFSIVEFKSKISPKYLEGFKRQLGIYHYAFEQLFGKSVDNSYLTCVQSGKVYPFKDSDFDHMETEYDIIEIADKSKCSLVQ